VITTDQLAPSTDLPKPLVKPMLRLFPFLHEGKTFLRLQYPPESKLYSKLKGLKQVKWSRTYRCFITRAKTGSLHLLFDELLPIAHMGLSQQIQLKDLLLVKRLWEQMYSWDHNFLSCPVAYLERMQLLGYSPRTMRTYHSLLLRFLNTYAEQGLAA
jgi:hypothetical protein